MAERDAAVRAHGGRVRRRVLVIGQVAVLIVGAALAAPSSPMVATAVAGGTTRYVGGCGGGGGYTGIQDAVDAADPGDTIHLCAATYTLSAGIAVDVDGLTFQGDDSTDTTVNGGGLHQAFAFTSDVTTATFADLTITGGETAGTGGAIDLRPATASAGRLTIESARFSANHASGKGGAISVAGSAAMRNVTFTDNTAGAEGGAVYFTYGSVTLSDGTFTGNRGTYGGAIAGEWSVAATIAGSTFQSSVASGHTYSQGGHLYLREGTASISDSTFVGGYAQKYGGAISIYGDYESAVQIVDSTLRDNVTDVYGGAVIATNVTVRRSTFVGNRSLGTAGAIFAYGCALSCGTADISSSTFVDNHQASGGTVFTAALTVRASTFADNTGGSGTLDAYAMAIGRSLVAGPGGCAAASVTDLGGNIVTDPACLGGSPSPDSSSGIALADFKLKPLADNGGPTETMALLRSSPAVDRVTAATCVGTTDQRGVERPQLDGCDSGAFELAPARVTPAFNGPWSVNSSTALTKVSLSAFVTPSAEDCDLRFDVSGTVWTTSGSTGDTTSFTTYGASTSDGIASGPIANVPLGLYDVVVSIVPGACLPADPDDSTATGTLSVLPGTVPRGSVGGGWYRLAPTGGWARNSFGYVISVGSTYSKRTGVTTTTTRGQLLWMSDADNSAGSNGWRLKASIALTTTDGTSLWQRFTCPPSVTTGTTCGRFSGSGLVQQWDGLLWQTATDLGDAGLVRFTVTVYDGGSLTSCARRVCRTSDLPDLVGIAIGGLTEPTVATAALPHVGAPRQLRSGGTRIY